MSVGVAQEPKTKEKEETSPVIEVSGLWKRYGRVWAVRDATFQVPQGQIVGLLGPNGAGKSTILRILSCYIPATAGTVRIAGLDAFRDSDAIRRRIGYMPEHNPLYPEMRVLEYLKFRGRLKGLRGKRLRERLEVVIDQCGLQSVLRKLIGALSKGYRQRVGLADALLHEPDLVLLDEPTIGLDPYQVRAFRDFIRGLAGRHTIVLSSHILPEVELICDRVLIVHEGRVLDVGPTRALRKRIRKPLRVIAEIQAPQGELVHQMKKIFGLRHMELEPSEDGYVRCILYPELPEDDLRPAVQKLTCEQGWPLRELVQERPTLEDVFIELTQHGKGKETA